MDATYFKPSTVRREALVWAVATRMQIDRWEPLVLAWVRAEMEGTDFPGRDHWRGQIEHHFLVVAARQLIRAIGMLDPPEPVDNLMRKDIIGTRDLQAHWDENMPVFNRFPRSASPARKSGQSYMETNPAARPYVWQAWNSDVGARVTPNATSDNLRGLVDRVEARVLAEEPSLAAYVPHVE